MSERSNFSKLKIFSTVNRSIKSTIVQIAKQMEASPVIIATERSIRVVISKAEKR